MTRISIGRGLEPREEVGQDREVEVVAGVGVL